MVVAPPFQTGRPFARKVLVLYAPADEAFARGYLAAALGLPLVDEDDEDDASNRDDDSSDGLALSSRALARRPMRELNRLVRESRLVVPVITPAFLADPWLQLSDELASHGAVTDGDDAAGVAPLLLGECEVPLHLRAGVSLDFRDPRDWDDELARLRAQLEQPPAPPPELPCPYPGMRPYRAADAAYFHGRHAEIADVISRLERGTRELYVIGPSGSGKSSLIAAGVVPRLLDPTQRQQPQPPRLVRALRPGATPLQALADALSGDGGELAVEDLLAQLLLAHPGAELLIFVDQAEELFSLASAAERHRFAAALRAVRAEPRCTLLLTLRADFFAELIGSELWNEGSKQHVALSPIRGELLRQAIAQPARQLHVFFEPALLAQLLADADDEPGALPLLQEALVQLWGQRRHRLLTVEEYRAMGGLSAALVRRADQVLRELPAPRQTLARRVLLRLVAFGEGRPHTRRRQLRAELRGDESADELDAVLRALSSSRLVIMDAGDTVDLCHDVLITAWPSFHEWVGARLVLEQRRRQLQVSARAWIARGRGDGSLLGESELAEVARWRHGEAVRELGEAPEVTELIAQSYRALEQARRRRRQRVQTAIIASGAFLLVSLFLIAFALLQKREAFVQESRAQLVEQEVRHARHEQARQLESAGRRLLIEGHPQRAIPYLVAARERQASIAPGEPEPAQQNLRMLFAAATRHHARLTVSHPGRINALELSRDASFFTTTGDDGEVRLWSTSSGLPLRAPLVHAQRLLGSELSPDGRRLVTLCSDGLARLWDLSEQAPVPLVLREAGELNSLSFSADSRLLVTGGRDGTARLWDVRDGTPFGPPMRHSFPLDAVLLSPDGWHLAAISHHLADVSLWTLGPHPVQRLLRVDYMTSVQDAAFSADGARIAITYWGGPTAAVHDVFGEAPPKIFQHDETVLQVLFLLDGGTAIVSEHSVALHGRGAKRILLPPSPILRAALAGDGRTLLTWGSHNELRLWDTLLGEAITDLETSMNVENVAFSADGRWLVTAPDRHTATLWQLSPHRAEPLQIGRDGIDATFSPDGDLLATTSFGGIFLWNPHTGQRLAQLDPPGLYMPWQTTFSPDGSLLAHLGWERELSLCWMATLRCRALVPSWMKTSMLPIDAVIPLAFSPDGSLLAASASADTVQLWDTATGEPLGPPLQHSRPPATPDPMRHGIASVSFSPDGQRLVTAGDDGRARVWDVATRQPLAQLRHPVGNALSSALFSPDGQRLVTTSVDGSARLWEASTLRWLAALDHEAEIFGAAFSPDGHKLATYGRDSAVKVWDAGTGKLSFLLRLDSWAMRLVFSADGARFVTIADGAAQLWDADTGEPISARIVHSHPGDAVFPATPAEASKARWTRWREEVIRDVQFSPDDRQLLTIGTRDEARFWDLGLDETSLDQWRQLGARNPFPPLATP